MIVAKRVVESRVQEPQSALACSYFALPKAASNPAAFTTS